MGATVHNLCSSAETDSNAFKILGCSILNRGSEAGHFVDTFQLKSFSSSIPSVCDSQRIKRKWSLTDELTSSSLCLSLGRSSSSLPSKDSFVSAYPSMSSPKQLEEESKMDPLSEFTLHFSNGKTLKPKRSSTSGLKELDVWPKVDLELSLSSGIAESDLTSVPQSSASPQSSTEMSEIVEGSSRINEVSDSIYRRVGSLFDPMKTVHEERTFHHQNQTPRQFKPITLALGLNSSLMKTPKCSVTCTSGITHQQQRSSSTKQCQFDGCIKGARGASGLCIAHGGGRRCQRSGCNKGAEGRTAFCKAHGGGRRCEFLGCTKSAEGRTDFCISHGGGRRCSHEGCTRAARGKSGLCIRHGGGKRCQKENCTKSAEGLSGLCISHGGGRRCQYPQCSKGAQGSTIFCKAHGGGKRCTFEGCNKGAEGSTAFCKGHGGGKRCSFEGGSVCPKSVHGGTLFCVAHGGGKRCAVPECTKSARGRTDFCVRHGGGKRCKFERCEKSAQGSTDFCKAHGGGKRCSWGQPNFEFGQGDDTCNSFARGKTGLCSFHSALVRDKRVHGGATLGALVQDSRFKKMKNIVDNTNRPDNEMTYGWRSDCKGFGFKQAGLVIGGGPSSVAEKGPEGRVHGGSLLAILAGGSGVSLTDIKE